MDERVGAPRTPRFSDRGDRRRRAIAAEAFDGVPHTEVGCEKRVRVAQGAQGDIVRGPRTHARQSDERPAGGGPGPARGAHAPPALGGPPPPRGPAAPGRPETPAP